MRLFLASSDLGDYSSELIKLVGKNRKVLVVANARDYCTPEDGKRIVDEDLEIIANCGLIPTELDLRPYFKKSDELRKYIDDFNPGCVFVTGGNIYVLATALYLSGMDGILKHDLADDKYVYAGYSAGAMNASKDLINYCDSYGERDGDKMEEARSVYGEVCTNGLGLIEEYVCPHADAIDFSEACKKAEEELKAKGLESIVLNDADVLVIDGDKWLRLDAFSVTG